MCQADRTGRFFERRKAKASMPRDMIAIQSFMWVQGFDEYEE